MIPDKIIKREVKAYYLPTRKETVSGIPSGREFLYENALRQTKINKSQTKIKYGLKFDIANLEEEFKKDQMSGVGFIIDTSISYENMDADRDALINSDSIFSYKYGYRSDDPKIVQLRRCSCDCGASVSQHAGGVCPSCGTLIKPLQKIRGWIVLKHYKVFNPTWLTRFFKYSKKGKMSESLFKTKYLFNFKPGNEYFNIFDLQPDANGHPSPNLVKMINDLVLPEYRNYFMSTINAAMTNCIPVISKEFRHFDVVDNLSNKSSVRTHEMNKMYINISNKAHQLNNLSKNVPKSNIIKNLKAISQKFDEIQQAGFDEIGKGKESLIRGKAISKRVDNSFRLIIEGLLESSRMDTCVIPFKIFGEITVTPYESLYRKHGATPESINRMKSNIPNRRDCDIMVKVLQELHKEGLNFLIVYRAPAIYMLSQSALEIIGLSGDIEQVCKINAITVDAVFVGDFDGDSVGGYHIATRAIAPIVFALSPKRLAYNPITGMYNSGFNLIEGLYLTVYSLFDKPETHINDSDILTEAEFKKLGLK